MRGHARTTPGRARSPEPRVRRASCWPGTPPTDASAPRCMPRPSPPSPGPQERARTTPPSGPGRSATTPRCASWRTASSASCTAASRPAPSTTRTPPGGTTGTSPRPSPLDIFHDGMSVIACSVPALPSTPATPKITAVKRMMSPRATSMTTNSLRRLRRNLHDSAYVWITTHPGRCVQGPGRQHQHRGPPTASRGDHDRPLPVGGLAELHDRPAVHWDGHDPARSVRQLFHNEGRGLDVLLWRIDVRGVVGLDIRLWREPGAAGGARSRSTLTMLSVVLDDEVVVGYPTSSSMRARPDRGTGRALTIQPICLGRAPSRGSPTTGAAGVQAAVSDPGSLACFITLRPGHAGPGRLTPFL